MSPKTTQDQMKRSWLVQRLRRPRTGPLAAASESLAFGGGLRNGGLTPAAMDILRGIFSFDYMGAAEFEFGAVPQALQSLASIKSKKLQAGSFQIPLAAVAADWRARKAGTDPVGEATVYFLCRREQSAEVEVRARTWAAEGYQAHLKESPHLSSTLRPFDEWDGDVVGWLELDNGFFLFADRQMWLQTCALFGVTASEGEAA